VVIMLGTMPLTYTRYTNDLAIAWAYAEISDRHYHHSQ